jgi:UDP-2-acetamido-3-amino-2,3-dideoxy-glucuronate N-acetyltransferase
MGNGLVAGIHPTAIVEEGAHIGEGTKVWHWTHIMDADIGKNCNIGQGCFIADNVRIGNGCKIQNNVSVYKGVTLGDYVFVGPHATFTNVKRPRSAEPTRDYVKTIVEDYASIGANATIVCGVTIGQGAMIGAGAVVTKDVMPGETVVGNPAAEGLC